MAAHETIKYVHDARETTTKGPTMKRMYPRDFALVHEVRDNLARFAPAYELRRIDSVSPFHDTMRLRLIAVNRSASYNDNVLIMNVGLRANQTWDGHFHFAHDCNRIDFVGPLDTWPWPHNPLDDMLVPHLAANGMYDVGLFTLMDAYPECRIDVYDFEDDEHMGYMAYYTSPSIVAFNPMVIDVLYEDGDHAVTKTNRIIRNGDPGWGTLFAGNTHRFVPSMNDLA